MLLAATQPVPQAAAQPVPRLHAAAIANDQQNAIEIDASDWQLTDQEWAAISGEIARNGY